MGLKRGGVVLLTDNKEYAVAATLKMNSIDYVYIMDLNDYKNFKICKIENEELVTIVDPKLYIELVNEFNKILTEK